MAAKGWELHYVLSFTAYSEEPEPGEYWGQVALICLRTALRRGIQCFLEGIRKGS